ncbi:MAG: Ig-like domain-containing protein, partial [Clostridia bacterium]|nr:Ig-like domain-containing protein [Clostridia bacterium]
MSKKIISILLCCSVLISSGLFVSAQEDLTDIEVVSQPEESIVICEETDAVDDEIELLAASTWEDATQLVAGAKTAFNLPASGSVAWFKIDVENDDEAIKLSFDGFDSTSNHIYYRLYKGTDLENNPNTSCLQQIGSFNTDLTRTYKVPEAGSYYVKVFLNNNNYVLEKDINISYTIVAPDSNENNDTWQNATELIRDVDSSYTLNGQNDVDWFKISVANDTDAIKLVMSNFDYTVNRVSYYLYKGTELEAGNTSYIDSYTNFYTNMSRNFKVYEAGDYYVKVVMYHSGSEWNEKALKIRYEIVDGDANENNETKENATYLTDSVPMEFTMTGHNDVEWFCFDTTIENETVTLTIEGFETDYSNQIRVVLYDEDTVNSVFTAEPNSYYTRTASFINTGTKYIKISVYNGKIAENPLKITYSGGTGKKDFNEANNTWQTATPLAKDAELQFNLPATSDTDWFVVDVDNPDEAVELNFSGFEPSSASIYYHFYSGADLNKYGSNASPMYTVYGISKASNRTYKVTEPGKYYIKVGLYNGSSITEYMTVKYSAIEPDENENNDTWKNATMLEQDVDTPYTLHGYNDVDWFKINVKNPDEAIQLNFSGFKVNTSAISFAMFSEEDFIKYGNNASYIDHVYGFRYAYSRHYKVKNPGNYYVKVAIYEHPNTVQEPLAISYNIIEPDEHEYNNTWKTATTLQEDINKSFTLTGHNDVDWFKITVNDNQAIKLWFDGFETNGGRIYYNLYSGKDFELNGDSASSLDHVYSIGSAYSRSYKITNAGEYYVKVGVYDYGSHGILKNPITIKYSVDYPDSYENSDSYANAIKTSANQTIYHTLNGHNDADYFEITGVTTGDTINIHTSGYSVGNSHKRGYYNIYYYNAETEGYEHKGNGYISQDNQTIKYVATADGTYYFRVTSTDTVTPITNTKSFRYTLSRDNAPVENIKLNYESVTLNEGVNTTFVASFTPSYATNQNLTWTSSNSEVVSVDSYGNISCLTVGKATITATSEDGGYTSSCVVTV